MSPAELAKLRLDATNILTWEVPKDGDPLAFMHLRRFAKAVLDLSAPASPRVEALEEAAKVADAQAVESVSRLSDIEAAQEDDPAVITALRIANAIRRLKGSPSSPPSRETKT